MRCFCGWSIEVPNNGANVGVNLHEIGRKNSLSPTDDQLAKDADTGGLQRLGLFR